MFNPSEIQQTLDALKHEREEREDALEKAAYVKDELEHKQELLNKKQL